MLIDGYNYLFRTNPDLASSKQLYGEDSDRSNPAFDTARTQFHQQLKSFLRTAEYEIVVVYDSSQAPKETSYQLQDGPKVVYTSHKAEADSYILKSVKQLSDKAAMNPYETARTVFIISGDARVTSPALENLWEQIFAYPPLWLQRQFVSERDLQRRAGLLSSPAASKQASVRRKAAALDTVKFAQRYLQQQGGPADAVARVAARAGLSQHGGGMAKEEEEVEEEDEESWAKKHLAKLEDENVGKEVDEMLSDDFLRELGIDV